MEIVIETLIGSQFEVKVTKDDTILSVKHKIQRLGGIPVSQQHLLFQEAELSDHTLLKDHKIADGARLRLVLGMRGGPLNTYRTPTLRLQLLKYSQLSSKLSRNLSSASSNSSCFDGSSSSNNSESDDDDEEDDDYDDTVQTSTTTAAMTSTKTSFFGSTRERTKNLIELSKLTEQRITLLLLEYQNYFNLMPLGRKIEVASKFMAEFDETDEETLELETNNKPSLTAAATATAVVEAPSTARESPPLGEPPLFPTLKQSSTRLTASATAPEVSWRILDNRSSGKPTDASPVLKSLKLQSANRRKQIAPHHWCGDNSITASRLESKVAFMEKLTTSILDEGSPGSVGTGKPVEQKTQQPPSSSSDWKSMDKKDSKSSLTSFLEEEDFILPEVKVLESNGRWRGCVYPELPATVTISKPLQAVKNVASASTSSCMNSNTEDLLAKVASLKQKLAESKKKRELRKAQVVSEPPPPLPAEEQATPDDDDDKKLIQVNDCDVTLDMQSGTPVTAEDEEEEDITRSTLLNNPNLVTTSGWQDNNGVQSDQVYRELLEDVLSYIKEKYSPDSSSPTLSTNAVVAAVASNPTTSTPKKRLSIAVPSNVASESGLKATNNSIVNGGSTGSSSRQPILPSINVTASTGSVGILPGGSSTAGPRKSSFKVAPSVNSRMLLPPLLLPKISTRKTVKEEKASYFRPGLLLSRRLSFDVAASAAVANAGVSLVKATNRKIGELDEKLVSKKPIVDREQDQSEMGQLPGASSATGPNRCFFCKRRTGLASNYVCHCGKNFCSLHRYPEAHKCPYDYKSAARQVICEANPVVTAPKLPKI